MINRVFLLLLMLTNYDSRGKGGGGGAPSGLVSYFPRSLSYKKHFDKILLVILHKEMCILCLLVYL